MKNPILTALIVLWVAFVAIKALMYGIALVLKVIGVVGRKAIEQLNRQMPQNELSLRIYDPIFEM